MKPTKRLAFLLLAAPIACACATSGSAAPAASATATEKAALLLSLTTYDNAIDRATDGVADGHQSDAASFSVGLLEDGSYNRLERGVLVFGLPEIPKGKRLVSAVLRLHVRVVGSDGEATVYHSRQQNRRHGTNEFHDDPSYSELVGVAATPPTDASHERPARVELDVVRQVLADYQSDFGSVVSSFRIQVDDLAFRKGRGSNRYSFFGKTAPDPAHAPVLELTFAPGSR